MLYVNPMVTKYTHKLYRIYKNKKEMRNKLKYMLQKKIKYKRTDDEIREQEFLRHTENK